MPTAATDTDAAPLLRQILLDPQGWEHTPPVFADWLEERGDPRGPLLLRRWRMAVKVVGGWREWAERYRKHETMPIRAEVLARYSIDEEVDRFHWYVLRKFDAEVDRQPGQRGIKYEFLFPLEAA